MFLYIISSEQDGPAFRSTWLGIHQKSLHPAPDEFSPSVHYKNGDYGFISYKVEIFDKDIIKYFKTIPHEIWELKYKIYEVKYLQKYIKMAQNINYSDL